jgi:hypothetical protein
MTRSQSLASAELTSGSYNLCVLTDCCLVLHRAYVWLSGLAATLLVLRLLMHSLHNNVSSGFGLRKESGAVACDALGVDNSGQVCPWQMIGVNRKVPVIQLCY